MLPRFYADLEPFLQKGRVLILYGPRRAGKTTLLESFLKQSNYKYRLDTGDNLRIQELLSSNELSSILEYVKGYQVIAIDEAQQIPNIARSLKLIVDQSPETIVVATGSSSFDLSQHVGEPLTGRKRTLTLYPIAQYELAQTKTPTELREELENFLVFGGYPEIVVQHDRLDKIELLNELVDSYMLKDILALDGLKSPRTLLDLVKLLAFQVGQLVSHHELATQLHVDTKTVSRYMNLLEQSFIIYRLTGFSRNLRKEITRKHKYYFLDNGMRNAVIKQFNRLENRNDIGALWENFLITERLKRGAYQRFYGSRYFWRTYEGQEVDLVEEVDGDLAAFEMKWGKRGSPPKLWKEAYPDASFEIVNKDNYLSFTT